MAVGRAATTIEEVRDPDRIKRYTLVPRSPVGAKPDGVRRFTLARVGSSPGPASGVGRLERMEQIAAADREREARDGGDPASRSTTPGSADQDSLS